MPIFCLNLVCPLVWINYSRTPNNRIAGLYKTALSSLCNDFLSPFSKLLEKDKSVTIHHRNLRTLALKIFKMKNSMATKKFPSGKAIVILETLQHTCHRTVMYGLETISSFGQKRWHITNRIKKSCLLYYSKSHSKKFVDEPKKNCPWQK